jgi:hypothetical protein
VADIKANNVMVQITSPDNDNDDDADNDDNDDESAWKVKKVQLVDLEDAAHLRHPDAGIVGAQLGNIMWRSPEAHAMGPIRKAADMFSFGLVVCERPVLDTSLH